MTESTHQPPRFLPPEIRAQCLKIKGQLHHGWMECEACGTWRAAQAKAEAAK